LLTGESATQSTTGSGVVQKCSEAGVRLASRSWHILDMGYGRLVKVTANSPDGGDLQPVIYVVAEGDSAKAMRIVGAEVQVNANIEALGRASNELLNALKLAPGEFIRL